LTPSPSHPEAKRNAWTAAGVMTFLATVVNLGGILAGVYNDRATSDQRDYHLLVIEQFSRQFPHPDLSDYRSATGPGYHLALAVVHRWITSDPQVLRATGAVFTLGLFALLGWATGRHVRWTTAMALCLPLLASLYVFVSGVWLLPDNLAWLTVLAALLLAFRERVDAWTYIGATILLAAAVFVRQINLWPLGVLTLGAMIAVNRDSDNSLAPKFSLCPTRLAAILLTGVPALLILAWFYRMWHGLTPPAFQTVEGPLPPGHSKWQHEGPNFAVPAMVLSVLAMAGFFFAPFVLPTLRATLSDRRRSFGVLLIGMAAGLATALLVATDFNHDAGRYSGLWNVSKAFPVLAHRSLLIAALAAAGGAVVMTWFLALDSRGRWLWLATWACFIVAQSANAKAWHKYYEPFCLIMLALAAGRVTARGGVSRWAVVGPILLTMLLAGVTLWSLKNG
jgi:hypothetical protein